MKYNVKCFSLLLLSTTLMFSNSYAQDNDLDISTEKQPVQAPSSDNAVAESDPFDDKLFQSPLDGDVSLDMDSQIEGEPLEQEKSEEPEKNGFDSAEVEVTAVNINTVESNAFETSMAQFEIKVSHPSYSIFGLDEESSKVKSIYVYDKPPRDILKLARKKHEDEKLKEKEQQDAQDQRGIFKFKGCLAGDGCELELIDSNTSDGNLYVSYRFNKLGLEEMRNLWVVADLNVKYVEKNQEEGKTLIEDVLISNTKQSKISNDDISFVTIANGNYKGSAKGNLYGFNITEFDKYVKMIQIVDVTSKEVLSTIESKGNSFYIEEGFIGQPITLAITYYDLKEGIAEFNQYLINK